MRFLSVLRDLFLDLTIGSRRRAARRGKRRRQPEEDWLVSLTGERLSVADPKGETRELVMADLSRVVIETNDSGPWGSDFWWLLFGPDGELVLAFPQGASGEKAAMDRLLALPGFDHEAMTRAACCVDNATFPVWER